MIRELDTAVLTHDMLEHGLVRGDLGAVVHCYSDGAAFEVEYVTAAGKTVALLTLTPQDIRPISDGEILHVREFGLKSVRSVQPSLEQIVVERTEELEQRNRELSALNRFIQERLNEIVETAERSLETARRHREVAQAYREALEKFLEVQKELRALQERTQPQSLPDLP